MWHTYRHTAGSWYVPFCVGRLAELPPRTTAVCRPGCQNGGVCIGANVCQCPPGFSGAQCQTRLEQCNEPRPSIYNARLRCSDT